MNRWREMSTQRIGLLYGRQTESRQNLTYDDAKLIVFDRVEIQEFYHLGFLDGMWCVW